MEVGTMKRKTMLRRALAAADLQLTERDDFAKLRFRCRRNEYRDLHFLVAQQDRHLAFGSS